MTTQVSAQVMQAIREQSRRTMEAVRKKSQRETPVRRTDSTGENGRKASILKGLLE